MEQSILTSTKKILGIHDDYETFDLDIITHINMAFSTLNQLGVGPESPIFTITDNNSVWADVGLSDHMESLVKTYVYLKVRMLFDPPSTSFVIEAMNKQVAELEWRISNYRETELMV